MKYWSGFFVLLLVACAPQQQSPYQQRSLPEAVVKDYLSSFSTELSAKNVQISTAKGNITTPNTTDALLYVIQQFKKNAVGFCPPAEGSFLADKDDRRFISLLVKGSQARILVYERTNVGGLYSVTANAYLSDTVILNSMGCVKASFREF